ncbi:protein-glutamate O-methyltransferase CheR [Devosia oryziradicis]|uniref:Chemotaxis protein methyltransferase n=1 Tax=Devosia oryziradicis TaxID=2801335 RepID=A0ABX7C464_9HYPH|nr:protein-glutamate O-methyltransferase CheR [Devosia oryziradicis]QQR36821.1 protein-glutamate O-methyltransferase CheR [Devosia oryziradicis]
MEQGEISLSDREFSRIKSRVYQVAGISLSDAKRTLVISRLSKIVRALGLAGFDAYVDYLERSGSAQDGQDFVNALTTNLTRFYREDHHFEHLRSYVGGLIADKPRGSRLRLWSAGCSTGQEPYTLGMDLLAAYPELKRWDFKILATDIDTAVIAKAARGVYPENELNGLSAERARLFEKTGDGQIRIPSAVRELVSFKPLNLIGPNWPMKGPFDAIFCRNVAIYFDKPTQGEVFGRLGKLLAPEGFLYIGHSENLGSGGEGFRLVGKTIYQSKLKQSKREAA